MRRSDYLKVSSLLALAILSFGARLYSADAAALLAPQELHAGGRSSLTLTTLDDQTQEPLARAAAITLVRGGEVVATLFSGATGEDGRIRVGFDVPDLDTGSYQIEARISGIADALVVDTTLSAAPAILIETDKPIYKPGQTIQGRVLLLNNALRPTAGEVELSIHDAKGIRIDRRQLSAGEFGAAEFSLDLATQLNLGVWKIKARSDDVESVRDIRVERYVLPRFDIELGLDKSWSLVDEEIDASVQARYFFGKDVSGHATIVAKRYVAEWEEYARVEGELNEGRLDFTLPAVEFVAGSPSDGGQGSVTLDIEVTDSTGHTQTTTEVVRITQSELVLGLVPRAQILKPTLPFDVVVTGRDPEGRALDADVTLSVSYQRFWGEEISSETVDASVRDGIATATLRPPEGASVAEIDARSTYEGRASTATVRVEGSYSSGNSYLSLSRVHPDATVRAGSLEEFTVQSTHPGTVYYEVYGRGRTILSGASEEDTFSIAVTPEMAPKVKVLAYKINPDNEVSADSVSFSIELESTLNITAGFDQANVSPGDAVELTIDAGTAGPALLGVAVVDESVLALGQSRLHLASVFAELERRFLEPKAEVHEVGGGEQFPGGAPFDDGFFSPPQSHGAKDVIESVGLRIVTTPNLRVLSGRGLWDDFAEFDGPPVAAPDDEDGGAAGSASGEPPVRVRQYFPETWVWEPLLMTDADGKARLELTAPDSITNWKLSVVSTSAEGLGFGESDLTVFQEFFVEPSLPYAVTRGEEFPLKVDVFNYVDETQTVTLDFQGADWFEFVGEAENGAIEVTVPPQSATSVDFPIRPTLLGTHEIELLARGTSRSDAVRRAIIVEPEGVTNEAVFNSVIEAGSTVAIDVSFPENTVAGSARACLNVTPSPVAQTMQGISDLLSMPYGCGEQNMIFLAPDVEILKYLREIGELSVEIRATAEHFVNVGYQRQLTYQTDDGGFAAFGGAEGSLWLSAFVLSTFSSAREVRDIDELVLSRTADMLVGRQEASGSFRTDDFLIHKEMDGGLENIYAMAAYVTNALADYSVDTDVSDRVRNALELGAAFLRDNQTTVRNDPYSLSIAAVALGKVPGFEVATTATIDRLLELAKDDGVGLHWEPYPVETTGYAAMAMLAADRSEAIAPVEWLSTQRNALGGYGQSTQDTVVAIRALFSAARKVSRDLDVELSLVRGDETVWTQHINASNFDVLHTAEIPLGDGYELRSTGRGNVGYQVARKFNVPGSTLPPPRDMLIEVDYDTSNIEVDDIVDVHVRLLYSGEKSETGMAIADIGVPTGFEVVASTTQALIDDGTVSRVDIAGRKAIFYIDSLVGGQALEFSFAMRARYPVRAEGPVSRAYEYYDSTVEAYHRMGDIRVIASIGESAFVRGDSNVDASVDLSDAVTTLGYLFGGEGAAILHCFDAADSNDDGRLNITDPIFLLQHLFLGGPAPTAPFPDLGIDPTLDDLSCARGI